MKFSLIIPCFNEQGSISLLLGTLKPLLTAKFGDRWEVIFVDDGSCDSTRHIILKANKVDDRIKGVFLSRNFGHQPAIFAGLVYATGTYVGVMDADMQDPPAVLMECLDKATTDNLDIVYAVRKNRRSSRILKLCYWCFYRLMGLLSSHPWPLDAGDFSVMSNRAVSLIVELPEHVRVLRGLRSWIGLRNGFVEYDRPVRAHGESKYGVLKLTALALNSLFSFSHIPLRLASLIGLLMACVSLVAGLFLLANRFFPRFTFFGYYVGANPGTTTIVLLLLFFGSLLFLCLGIIGEYLRILVDEAKRRPVAIVEARTGLETRFGNSDLVVEAKQ
jgi:glycosyltransferase involved in cell wall biosynthesis